MSEKKWQRPGYIPLLDEIERRGREKYGSDYPEPPTEADVRREAEKQFEEARRNYSPEVLPALGGSGGGARAECEVDIVIGRTVDDYIGAPPDPTKPLWTRKQNIGQLLRRTSIEGDLKSQFKKQRHSLNESIVIELRTALYGGKIEAIIENGLDDIPIPKMWWRLDEAAAAFETGQKDGKLILLKNDGSSNQKPTTNDVITKCRDWLAEHRRASPNFPPKPKPEFETEAQQMFPGLSKYAFGKAWKEAAQLVKAPGWGRVGRRKTQNVGNVDG